MLTTRMAAAAPAQSNRVVGVAQIVGMNRSDVLLSLDFLA